MASLRPNAGCHTVVNGRVVVRSGELQAPGLEKMLARHARIARDWQGVLEG